MRTKLMLTLAVLTLFAAACSSSTKTVSPPPTTTAGTPAPSTTTPTTAPATACNRPHPPGQAAQTFTFEGKPRTYQLYVPKSYDGTKNVAIVFNFHGFGSNAVQQMAYSNFRPLADRDDFIVVAPDGQGAVKHFAFNKTATQQNDIEMVSALLQDLEHRFCIDATRVYSTGMSDGGLMSSLLACNVPDTFAAVAPVAVTLYLPSCKQPPTPIMSFHGTKDPVVPYDGGKVNCCGGAPIPATQTSMAGWAKHNGCDASFTDTRPSSEVSRRTWSGCKDDATTISYSIVGGGHTWPGAAVKLPQYGLTTSQIDATATIWDFFKQHSRQ
jgi:polyhydroxybutyrate depolymerase